MVVYRWPEDKLDDKLLHQVSEEISGEDGVVCNNSNKSIQNSFID